MDAACERVGLVATNSIRGGSNRTVLDSIVESFSISEAWADEPWTVNGAAVRVSLICVSRQTPAERLLNGAKVEAINSDLTATASDITSASVLPESQGVAFIGVQKTGPFDIPGKLAREWAAMPSGPDGRFNSEVLLPYWNGIDVVRRPRDIWIVDFTSHTLSQAAYFVQPFAYVMNSVKPTREGNSEQSLRANWWLYARSRPEMRKATSALRRYIASARLAKHRLFVWSPLSVLADSQIVVVARDDDTTFGILHSRFHELWSLRLCTWLGVGNDPRYTPSTTFETFPFPEKLTPNVPATSYAADPRAQAIAAAARELVAKRDAWLNPPELVKRVPEVVPGYPDRILPVDAKAAAILKGRTLTNLYNRRGTPAGVWLDHLHRALDEAVAAAYGWPADLSDEDVLARLLALNRERAG